jgi:predicted small lipoprotein YifL
MRRILLLFAIIVLCTACGKKGPLIYPDMLAPPAPTAVTVVQSGLGMKISFVLPDKDKAGLNHVELSGAKIFRRETLSGQDPGCSACGSDFGFYKQLYLDLLDGNARRYGSLLILLDSDVRAGDDYAYKIAVFAKDKVAGEVSKPVSVTMVQPPLAPLLQAVSEPTEIKLEFSRKSPIEGTFVGYNLYRAIKGESLPYLPLNNEPLPGNSFTDSGTERHVTYNYAARMVVRMPNGAMVESALSNEATGILKEEDE